MGRISYYTLGDLEYGINLYTLLPHVPLSQFFLHLYTYWFFKLIHSVGDTERSRADCKLITSVNQGFVGESEAMKQLSAALISCSEPFTWCLYSLSLIGGNSCSHSEDWRAILTVPLITEEG